MAPPANTKGQLSLAEYLRLARVKCGLSLKQVESATDRLISPAYLCTVEKGKISKPSPMFLRALSSLYGISFEALAFLAGYPPMRRLEDNVNFSLSEFKLSRAEELELIRYVTFLRARNDTAPKLFKKPQSVRHQASSKSNKMVHS
jgi:HTH-type transcriptional regulator, competence development regulator